MAFSLNDLPKVKSIKSKSKEEKRKNIASCFMLIKLQEKITENVREALNEYLTNRIETTSCTNLSKELLSSNIKELLVFCCAKDYEDITEEDVIKHEQEILQQIRWCTEYKNTKRLIFDENDYQVFSKDSREIGTLKIF